MFDSIAMGQHRLHLGSSCFLTCPKINSFRTARRMSSMQVHQYGASIGVLYTEIVEQVKNFISLCIRHDLILLS